MKLLWKVQLDSPPRQMHNLFPALIAGDVLTAQGPRELAIVASVSDIIYGIDVAYGRSRSGSVTSTAPSSRNPTRSGSTCCARAG